MTISAANISLTMGVLGVVLSLVSIILALVSIFVTFKLYLAGNTVMDAIKGTLGEVKGHSEVAKTTSVNFTKQLLEAYLQRSSIGVTHSLTAAQAAARKQIDAALNGLADKVDEDLLDRVKRNIQNELEAVLRPVKNEASKLSLPIREEVASSQQSLVHEPAPHALITPDVASVLSYVRDNEPPTDKPEKNFIGARKLREMVYGGQPAKQNALQQAIDTNLLETYSVPNPKNPDHPTTALRLNRDHPVVKLILDNEK